MGYTHGQKWSDDKIREGLSEVIGKLQLDRMPSRKEVIQHYHGTGLAERISKEPGGWYGWASKMGLAMKESETGIGKHFESVAAEKLSSLGHEVEKMSQNFPYDLLVDYGVKIDVKASHLYRGGQGNFYTFNLEKSHCTCDIYILYLLTDESEIEKSLIVPSIFVAKNTQISVGEKHSIYHKFSEKWDYIEAYSDFLNNGLRSIT